MLFASGFVAELWGMVFGKARARRAAFWIATAAFGLETTAIAARWVATDALRELTGEKIQQRLK